MSECRKNIQNDFWDLFPQLIFEIDNNNNIKFLNEACESILGFKKEDYIKKTLPLENIFIPTDLNRIKKSIAENFRGNKLSGNVYKIYNKNKEEIELKISKFLIKQNGDQGYLKCVATKVISKDKKEIFPNKINYHLPIPYQSLNKKGLILDVNTEWVNKLGYSKEEVLGKDFRTFIQKDKIKLFSEMFIDYKDKGEINNLKINLITKNKKIISVKYSGKAEYYKEDFVCTHCVFNDITLQQETEKVLKESEKKFRELNATKDKFFSIIAHDLKNPFNDLMGFTQLLGLNIDKYDKPKIKEFVGIIHQSSKLAYNLLENLLDWSRAQTGTLKFEPQKILVNEVVNETVNLLKSTANKKNINIFSELDKKVYAFADKNMVSTIIRNLVSNAIKYTNQGGYINISSYCNRNYCEIIVTDNGIGIEEKNIDKLFKIEEGFSTSGTEREKGTGLGLILCKEFAEKNGGKIWVKSKPGKGSSFSFAIPLPKPDFFDSE